MIHGELKVPFDYFQKKEIERILKETQRTLGLIELKFFDGEASSSEVEKAKNSIQELKELESFLLSR